MSFRIKHYTVKTNKSIRNGRIAIAFLSDLHLTEHGDGNRDLLDAIIRLSPDMVIAGGDIVTAKDGYTVTVAEELLCRLSKYFPVYCALGNHELRLKEKIERFGEMYELYVRHLSSYGIRILDNESLLLEEDNIRIYGLNLPLLHYKRFTRHQIPLEEMYDRIGEPDKDEFSILLAHHPRFAETYFKWGADLTLSGHVHGGVMRLFKRALISPDFQILPKYGYGEFTNGDQKLLISGGLGEHTIPFRLFNPKELVYIEIIQEVSHGDSR